MVHFYLERRCTQQGWADFQSVRLQVPTGFILCHLTNQHLFGTGGASSIWLVSTSPWGQLAERHRPLLPRHVASRGTHGVESYCVCNQMRATSPGPNPSHISFVSCQQNMADSFLDGDMTLDTFIDTYQSNRKLAHLRRVKIEKLQEVVLQGQRLPQASVSTSRSQDVSAAARAPSSALLADASSSNSSPVAQPRRKPPPPPSQPAPILTPAPAPTAAPQPPVFYSASQYPPIPPRTGQPFPSVPSGYPSHYLSQYPPALPQRPSPRLAPQPGFIMQ